jgi:hypothetical protein
MRPIPAALGVGPFTRSQARALGVSAGMFKGERFVRVLPRVWRLSSYEMTPDDWFTAARLCLPADARLTGLSRLQACGLAFGPARPLHFVREGDLHLDIPQIFLHRTKMLAPTDDVGVTPAAAFLFYCSTARVVDAIKVGDWLLSQDLMSVSGLHDLAWAAPWRDGAHEALWVSDYLDNRARSLQESETRAILRFAGLPVPEPNAPIDLGGDAQALGDLVIRPWGVVIEYEGRHHQEERRQYVWDIDRYALFRAHDVPYVQVTQEKLAHARTLVGDVFRVLVSRGYDGPPPELGAAWSALFRPIRDSVGSRADWLRDCATGRTVA